MIPIQLIIFSIPSIIYFFIQKRKGKTKAEIAEKLGFTISKLKYYCWGLLIALVLAGLSYFVVKYITPDIFKNEKFDANYYGGWTLGIGTIILAFLRVTVSTTLGEEIFFRGFLTGILIRKFGYNIGNILQALIFLLPHLFILTIDTSYWFYLIIIAVMGWVQGLLRYKSKSFFPGLLVHSVVNTFSAGLCMT